MVTAARKIWAGHPADYRAEVEAATRVSAELEREEAQRRVRELEAKLRLTE